jgi:hypothetical protein
LKRQFSSASSFMRDIIDVSIPPNITHHLKSLAIQVPKSQQKLDTTDHTSTNFNVSII